MKKSMTGMDSGNTMWVVIGVILILAIVYFVVRLFRNRKDGFSDYSRNIEGYGNKKSSDEH